MNRTKIEWADYTWNPVVGCKHGCPYCYARRLNKRFKWIESFSEPQIFYNRMRDPYKVKKPSVVFVGSMCDLFGDVIPISWMMDVLDQCRLHLQHTFMFLTKRPDNYRYIRDYVPFNCILGTSVTSTDDTWRIEELKRNANGHRTFVSVEPILGTFRPDSFDGVNRVIVGAMTGPGAVIPRQSWIESIKHDNILFKDNIKHYLK
jgi:protein gp37